MSWAVPLVVAGAASGCTTSRGSRIATDVLLAASVLALGWIDYGIGRYRGLAPLARPLPAAIASVREPWARNRSMQFEKPAWVQS